MPATTGSRRKAFRSSSNFDNEPIQFANSVGKCHVAILGSPFHGVLEIQQHHHCGRESHFHATPVFVPGEHVPMTGADGRFPRREPRRAAGRPPVSKKRSRDLVKCSTITEGTAMAKANPKLKSTLYGRWQIVSNKKGLSFIEFKQ